jgi:imidazolonepropionase-like amidohydrolase
MDAFNLTTTKGAWVAGLDDKTGGVAVGKYVDLVF